MGYWQATQNHATLFQSVVDHPRKEKGSDVRVAIHDAFAYRSAMYHLANECINFKASLVSGRFHLPPSTFYKTLCIL
jgi:hypothetical protein